MNINMKMKDRYLVCYTGYSYKGVFSPKEAGLVFYFRLKHMLP